MILAFLLILIESEPVGVSPRSTITLTGTESYSEVLTKLNQTGNSVIDGRDEYQRQNTKPIKLPAGEYPFWKALDTLASATELEYTISTEGITLRSRTNDVKQIVTYDGPWRARLVRRSIIAYENPALDRLLLQIELSIEPKMVPLQAYLSLDGRRNQYPFEGEPTKLIEVRLPRPPRSQRVLDKIILEGEAWLCPGRLEMSVPLENRASVESEGCRFSITQLTPLTGDRLSIGTELLYPEDSFDWESHQAPLLQSMKVSLRNGSEVKPYRSRELSTDAGRKTSARWVLPKVSGGWRVHLQAPSAPVKGSLRLEWKDIELP